MTVAIGDLKINFSFGRKMSKILNNDVNGMVRIFYNLYFNGAV